MSGDFFLVFASLFSSFFPMLLKRCSLWELGLWHKFALKFHLSSASQTHSIHSLCGVRPFLKQSYWFILISLAYNLITMCIGKWTQCPWGTYQLPVGSGSYASHYVHQHFVSIRIINLSCKSTSCYCEHQHDRLIHFSRSDCSINSLLIIVS